MHDGMTKENMTIALTGLLTVFTGLFCLYFDELLDPNDVEEFGSTLSFAVIVLGGSYLIIRNKMGYERCISFICAVLGLSLILDNLSMDPINDSLFILKFLDLCMGALLFVMSVSYLFKFRYNVLQMKRVLLFMIAFDLLPIWLEWYLGIPLADTLSYYLSSIPLLASYCAVMYMLSLEGIRVVPQMEQLVDGVERMSNVFYNDGTEYITHEDLTKILHPEDSGWKEVSDGPVTREVSIGLWHGVDSIPLTLRQWRSDGHISLEFDCGGTDMVASHLKFDVHEYVLSDDGSSITFYDGRGFFITLDIDEVRLGNSAVTNAYRIISKSELNGFRKD